MLFGKLNFELDRMRVMKVDEPLSEAYEGEKQGGGPGDRTDCAPRSVFGAVDEARVTLAKSVWAELRKLALHASYRARPNSA